MVVFFIQAALFSLHILPYSLLSEPHTGEYTSGQYGEHSQTPDSELQKDPCCLQSLLDLHAG
jgi:hypothetical protein